MVSSTNQERVVKLSKANFDTNTRLGFKPDYYDCVICLDMATTSDILECPVHSSGALCNGNGFCCFRDLLLSHQPAVAYSRPQGTPPNPKIYTLNPKCFSFMNPQH